MQHGFRFEFDVAFIRSTFRRDLFWKGAFFVGLMLVILVLARLWMGFFHPVVVGAVALGAAVIVVRLVVAYRSAGQLVFDLWSKLSPNHVIEWRLDGEGFDVVLEHGSSRYEWKGLRRLWSYPDVWILEIVKNMSVSFPPDAASEEIREFIVERCRAAGVRV